MEKTIYAILIIGLILLSGCTEQEQELYDKYLDAEYILSCYDIEDYNKWCSCLGGFVVDTPHELRRAIKKMCVMYDYEFKDIRNSDQLIQS